MQCKSRLSESLQPACLRPLWSSSMVSIPSWLTSKASKAWRKSLTLSSLSCRAMILSTARSNLLRVRKQLSLCNTRASRLTFCFEGILRVIHVCFKASSAVKRSLGLIRSNCMVRSFASLLTPLHTLPWSFTQPMRIFSKISLSDFPLKGARPLSRAYRVTPALHKSHCLSYFPMSTCGDTYRAVPARVCSTVPGLQLAAKPKSINFRVLSSSLSCESSRKFCGFRSRCAISWLCT
mmetsp:Transcript_91984/g.213798  ORF Transcript_91984/g.213798 Transcript_91984/m.213798 type:complete len:236 (-) Transcript_91984:627-1334(-)